MNDLHFGRNCKLCSRNEPTVNKLVDLLCEGGGNMAKRLVGKELIETTILELLEEKSIEQFSVAEIAENSGISTRAFYNHFCDKHEAVGAIYLRYMKPFVDCPLDEWYTHMSDFFVSSEIHGKHAVLYRPKQSGRRQFTLCCSLCQLSFLLALAGLRKFYFDSPPGNR